MVGTPSKSTVHGGAEVAAEPPRATNEILPVLEVRTTLPRVVYLSALYMWTCIPNKHCQGINELDCFCPCFCVLIYIIDYRTLLMQTIIVYNR